MAKITLNDIINTYNLTLINSNFTKIEDEFQNKALYRNNPTGEPNEMQVNLDMNNKRILNLPAPFSDNEPARLQDVMNHITSYPAIYDEGVLVAPAVKTLNFIGAEVTASAAGFDATVTVPPIFSTLAAPGGAALIGNTPAGGISSTTVQAALNELDSEKANLAALTASSGSSVVGFIQGGTGAVAQTLQDKGRERVSVIDYGAVSGALDNTTPFQNAIARVSSLGGGIVNVPPGTWLTGQITIPSNVSIRLAKGALVKPKAGFALNAFWLVSSSSTDVEIVGGSFEADRTTFPSTVVIYVDTAQNVKISNVKITKSGQIGVYVGNSQDVLIERVHSFLAGSRNIQIDGASSARCYVRKCRVDATGTIDHGIQFSGGGVDHEATSNYVTGSTIFGISLFNVSRCLVIKNTIYNTTREAINIQDGADNIVDKNVAYWDTTTSQDFGMSIWGQAVNGCNFNIMRGNKVINCGKSGIAIASTTVCKYNKVENNVITNSNRLNLGATNGGGAGVILYGSNAQFNDVVGNLTYDNIGFLKHGVFEWNSSGLPSNNRIFNNPTTNAAISNVNKSTSSVEGLNQTAAQAYTPTVTSGVGTITTLGTVFGRYWETDKLVNYYISATITTNGTGAQDIRLTLPYTNSSNIPGLAYGRESGVTGAMLVGTLASSSNTVIVRKYDNTYPGANSAVIEVSGFFVKA